MLFVEFCFMFGVHSLDLFGAWDFGSLVQSLMVDLDHIMCLLFHLKIYVILDNEFFSLYMPLLKNQEDIHYFFSSNFILVSWYLY